MDGDEKIVTNFSRVIKRRINMPCASLVKEIVYPKNLDHVSSINHGQQHEKTAIAQLSKQENIKIRPCVCMTVSKHSGAAVTYLLFHIMKPV